MKFSRRTTRALSHLVVGKEIKAPRSSLTVTAQRAAHLAVRMSSPLNAVHPARISVDWELWKCAVITAV